MAVGSKRERNKERFWWWKKQRKKSPVRKGFCLIQARPLPTSSHMSAETLLPSPSWWTVRDTGSRQNWLATFLLFELISHVCFSRSLFFFLLYLCPFPFLSTEDAQPCSASSRCWWASLPWCGRIRVRNYREAGDNLHIVYQSITRRISTGPLLKLSGLLTTVTPVNTERCKPIKSMFLFGMGSSLTLQFSFASP